MKKYAFISLIVLLAGCGDKKAVYTPKPVQEAPPAQVKEGEEATLFPFKEGNTWTYRVQVVAGVAGRQLPPDEREVTMKVSKVETTPDGVRAHLDIIQKDEVRDRQVWATNKLGIYQVAIGKDKPVYTAPPQPVILFPIKEDDTFNWKGWGMSALGKPADTEASSKILGPQEVDTLMGSMNAIAVESDSKVKSGTESADVRSTYYWTPKVGLVRYRQEMLITIPPGKDQTEPTEARSVTMMELKSYTVK
ncbi:MAG TPA: hypothetical protein VEX38_03715 [Fimbriimonadaceae bacterium]|nr:hypothetical protein [Fimbriimonadaceae bacterium]